MRFYLLVFVSYFLWVLFCLHLLLVVLFHFQLRLSQIEIYQTDYCNNHNNNDHSNTSRHKKSLRHLRIVFKLFYLDKAHIRCLQDNGNQLQNVLKNVSERHLIDVLLRCLRKTSQRKLLKMSSRRIFLNFQKKKKTFYFYLLISCFLIFGQNVVTILSFRRRCSNKKVTFSQRVYNVGFTTKYQRCSNNVVSLKSFSCIHTEKRDF